MSAFEGIGVAWLDALSDLDLRDEALMDLEVAAGVGVWTWNPSSEVMSTSPRVHEILGLSAPSGAVVTAGVFLSAVHPEDRPMVDAVLSGHAPAGGYSMDHRVIRGDGSVRVVHSRGRTRLDSTGRPRFAVGTVQDVTEIRAAAVAVSHSRDLFREVLDAATEQSIIGVDVTGLITVFNPGAERMLGYSAREMVGLQTPLVLHHPGDDVARIAAPEQVQDYRSVLGTAVDGVPDTRESTYVTKAGEQLTVVLTTAPTRDADDRINGYIEIGVDVTAQRATERALADTEALFSDTFDHAPIGIMLVAIEGDDATMLRVNHALVCLTGHPEQRLLTMSPQALLPETLQGDWYRQDLRLLIANNGVLDDREQQWVRADGSPVWVRLHVTPVRNQQADLVMALVEDITDRKNAETQLQHLALHDPLTGLPNRVLLLDRLEHALAASRRTDGRVAVLFVDLDGFKLVNDTGGHLAGDEVLTTAAARLSSHLRSGDTVARLGGDEFVVVCSSIDSEGSAHMVARRLLEKLSIPYRAGREVYHLSASIGVALSTSDSTAERLLLDADEAMYAAKDAGKPDRAGQRRTSPHQPQRPRRPSTPD